MIGNRKRPISPRFWVEIGRFKSTRVAITLKREVNRQLGAARSVAAQMSRAEEKEASRGEGVGLAF
jgi:hypothetical protein